MNKVYCNIFTNRVEQILKVEDYNELSDDYFNNCYAVKDDLGEVKGYNLVYNKEDGTFKEIEGIPAFEEAIVEDETKEIESIKEENQKLREEMEEIKKLLAMKGMV